MDEIERIKQANVKPPLKPNYQPSDLFVGPPERWQVEAQKVGSSKRKPRRKS